MINLAIFFEIIWCHFIYHFLWVTFTPEFVPRDQVFLKVASHAEVAGMRDEPPRTSVLEAT